MKTHATGYEVQTLVNLVEKIPVPKGNPKRWRLHTDDGLFLTEGSEAGEALNNKSAGMMALTIWDHKVIAVRSSS